MTVTVALIVAAGRGSRAGGDLPKQYRNLGGQPVLRRCWSAFALHARVDHVVTVIHPDDRALYDDCLAGLDPAAPVPGGATRQESCRNGLESLAAAAPRNVLIHDAARPLIDDASIDRVIDALAHGPAAISAVPVVDTLKRATLDGRVEGTVDRQGLWRAQTPQGFNFQAILEAHRKAAGQSLTDDSAVAESAGLAVTLVPGSEDNIKLTTDDDFARAETLIGGGDTRVGTGFDVHPFGPGERVMLCGVAIEHDRGLAGHSDADAGLHALTDAVLGAIGEGDIGSHFPPADPRWRGADSAQFLAHAVSLVAGRGGQLRHLDVTIICEAPKIAPHRAAMRKRIAEIAGLGEDRVSVKATTTEGLGFTGRGEGIAAQAIATVRL